LSGSSKIIKRPQFLKKLHNQYYNFYNNLFLLKIVIANEFFDEDAIVLSREAEKLNIKVIFINTNGFIGSIRI